MVTPQYSESNVLKRTLIYATKLGARLFRVNTGRAWTGSSIHKLPNGDLLIKNPRPFSTGVPNGFSDLVGWTPVTITPDFIGRTLAVFTALEVKNSSKSRSRVSSEQEQFLNTVTQAGGIASVIRNPEEQLLKKIDEYRQKQQTEIKKN